MMNTLDGTSDIIKNNSDIVIVIQNRAILNNYMSLIEHLSANNEKLTLVVNESVCLQRLNKNYEINIITYRITEFLAFWEEIFNYCNLRKHIHLSKSFNERYCWRVKKFSTFKPSVKRSGILNYLYLIRRYIALHHDSILIRLLSATNSTSIIQPLFYKIFKITAFKPIDELISSKGVIVVPYWGLNIECNFLLHYIKSKRAKRIKTILLQENWDNLSSKSVMYYKPDAIAVWGPQTKCHAIKIQGFSKGHIYFLQSPRYLEFYEYWNQVRRDSFIDNTNKTILFLGDSTESNEVNLITKISRYIQLYQPEWTILYRPHPFMHSTYKLKFTHENLPDNVRLDDEFVDTYFKNIRVGYSTEANLQILVERFKAADIIIAGGTTSFLESIMTLKPTLLINGKLRTVRALDKTHFEGVQNLDRVIIANEDDLCDEHLKELFTIYTNYRNQTANTTEESLAKINYYLDFNGEPYISRFHSIINKVNTSS